MVPWVAYASRLLCISCMYLFEKLTRLSFGGKVFDNPKRKTMKFSIKDFFSKCDQIFKKLRIWSHLLKKSLIGNFIPCAVIFGIIIESKYFCNNLAILKGLLFKPKIKSQLIHCLLIWFFCWKAYYNMIR